MERIRSVFRSVCRVTLDGLADQMVPTTVTRWLARTACLARMPVPQWLGDRP